MSRIPTMSLLHVLTAASVLPGFERELRLLPRLVGRGDTCVDIGAAHGVYTLPLTMLAGAAGRIVAFEPRADAARRLRRVAAILGLKTLRVETAALGAHARRGTLTIPRRRRAVTGRSYLSDEAVHDALDEGLRPGDVLDVDVTTLDVLRAELDGRIDFIKCDVEGAELHVFAGAHRVLTEDRPVVLCEVEARHAQRYGQDVRAVFDHFEALGYGVLVPPSQQWSSRNYIFVPTERMAAVAARVGWRPHEPGRPASTAPPELADR